MSGPNHLWSGDWQSESTRPAAARPHVVEPEPEPEPPAPRRWNRRHIALALYAAVAAAAVTVALVTSLGGSSKPTPKPHGHHVATPKGSSKNSGGRGLTTPTTASNPYGPRADWLGMQIDSTPNGVYIDAMNTSGAADAAGLEPGDQIVAIDNHDINSVPEIGSDTKGLKIGTPVEITVMRSSVEVHSQLIPMMQRPTIHP